MSSSIASEDAPGPYTGTLRYPLDALITLARSILKAKEDHHIALRDAADAAENEDEELEQSYCVADVRLCVFALDGKRWKAAVEEMQPEKKWDSLTLQHFEDPRASEKALFTLDGKVARIIRGAIQYRKDTRGEAPSDDPRWSKEDGLLDLLQLITKHKGLFSSPEDSSQRD